MTLNFSAHPGPRERQLQRKHNNLLFISSSPVTQEQINTAQREDHSAMQLFMEKFREVVQRTVKLDKQVETDDLLKLKAELEQLYTVSTGLSGEQTAILDAIKKLISAISKTLHSNSKDDAHFIEKLQDDEQHTTLHLHICKHPIVSDILNPDGIIGNNELMPTLLSESEDALQAALMLFSPEQQQLMLEEGESLLKQIEADGHSLPMARQRLAQMAKWLTGE